MRIGINAKLLSNPGIFGWSRYLANLLAELSRSGGVEMVLYIENSPREDHLKRLLAGTYRLVKAPPMPYWVWEQVWLPRRCARDKIELLHTPFHYGLPWFCPVPRVMTMHDAIKEMLYLPQMSGRRRLSPGNVNVAIHEWIARSRAQQFITVSNYSKRDLVQTLKIPPERIAVIHEAADSRFHAHVSSESRARVSSRYLLPERYIFYVGSWEERKNLPFLIEAFAHAELPDVGLVLAGGPEDRTIPSEWNRVISPLADRVRVIGPVDDDELPALYAEALCFVYPSRYEGFGLQLCEAMATGCPVMAARATSLPEVLGSGGETFQIEDSEELAGLLRRVAGDEQFRLELRRRAKERSAHFSWKKAALETLEVYSNVVRSHLRRQ